MNKVLVVVDMQNDFIVGALGTPEAQSIVHNVVDKINTYKQSSDTTHTIATRDTHTTAYLDTLEGKKLPVIHCVEGTKGWQIIDEVAHALSDQCELMDKYTFGSVALAEYLAERHAEKTIDSIELVGVCTDICVVSNSILIKNYLPDVEVVVDASCCAGVTPTTHESALETMRMCQVTIINE